METIHLVQLIHPTYGRRVAVVEEPQLKLLEERWTSIYQLALTAIDQGSALTELIQQAVSNTGLGYDSIYEGKADWKLLPAFDCPDNPFACLVSGTGLTHKSSALNRQMMHHKEADTLTDSMKMYQWGVEGGKPQNQGIGVQPEWFYKGDGSIVKAHREALEVPVFADDGGEEAEVAGIYIVDRKGQPWRLGYCNGNEFADHVMERKNYLYLAPSKLRVCSIGPELVIGSDLVAVEGKVSLKRNGELIWEQVIHSGEENMAHSLKNLEYHHFKYDAHRIPLQAHIHYFGADAFSFGNQVYTQGGDEVEISWEGLGRPLLNTIQYVNEVEKPVEVQGL